MSEAEVAIEAQGLSKKCGSQVLLRDASFVVRCSERVGVVGPAGTGKSVLVKLVLGFLSPDAGRVGMFAGEKGRRSAPSVGFLPQQPRLPQSLSARAFLHYCASLSGLPGRDREARVPEVLDAIGLNGAEGRSIRRLSPLGQRLVGLAQAVVASPALVVLDSPTAGLGRDDARSLLEALNRLCDERQTLLLTSRSVAEAQMCCQRVLWLSEGSIAEVRPSEAPGPDGRGSYERVLMVIDPPPAAALTEILVALGCRLDADGGGVVMEDLPLAREYDVLMAVLHANHRILELRREAVAAPASEVVS